MLNFRVASLTSECEAKGILEGRVCTLVGRVGDMKNIGRYVGTVRLVWSGALDDLCTGPDYGLVSIWNRITPYVVWFVQQD